MHVIFQPAATWLIRLILCSSLTCVPTAKVQSPSGFITAVPPLNQSWLCPQAVRLGLLAQQQHGQQLAEPFSFAPLVGSTEALSALSVCGLLALVASRCLSLVDAR
jgi:hypothetical protein